MLRDTVDMRLTLLKYITSLWALRGVASSATTLSARSASGGRIPVSGNGVYSATKAAMNAFSESLRLEARIDGG